MTTQLHETLRGGQTWSRRLARHQRLRLTDVEGRACVSALFYNALDPIERYNMPDTLKAQFSAFLLRLSGAIEKTRLSTMERVEGEGNTLSLLFEDCGSFCVKRGCYNFHVQQRLPHQRIECVARILAAEAVCTEKRH